ncbi:protein DETOXIFICATION 53 [Solanum lycopersicum]|uniref:Protein DETOXIFICATION n=1 Tax=Solanum lycopersicum TaxID=4081 RepID=A0A3Q7HZA6_SOLLC|nr:protein DETOXIFICATION 53 [Solanum lycopersicum]
MCTMNESREESDDIISITSDEMAAAAANIELTVKQREEEYVHTYSSRSNNLQLFQRVSVNQVSGELLLLGKIACPVALTTLLLFSKNIISMLFLGHMGKTELAGGSLAIGFANVTGYSVMKGLCMGMEPICSQAYGAKRWSVLTQTYFKMFLLLLAVTVPITFLWLNVEHVFLRLGQDRVISKVAKGYLIFSIPELLASAHLNPLRAFLRTQYINTPATLVATCSTILHLPITYFLVTYLDLNVKGIALASVLYSLNMNIGLLLYLFLSKVAIKPWAGVTFISTFQGWRPLLSLSLPSLFSVCLEWWWYEIVLFLSGLLSNPDSCVAAMGILIQTTGTIYVFPFSLGLSISQRVGTELGAGNPDRAKLAAIIGICVAMALGFTAFGVTIAMKSVWGKLYTNEAEILALISGALPILGLAEIGNAPQTAACGALTGSARPTMGVRINLAAFYLVGLPCACVFAFKLNIGFRGLWLGLVASQFSCLIMMVYTLMQTDWKLQARRAEDLTKASQEKDDAGTNLVP